jgi:DNA-binding transcriptional LysR family regulator
MMGSFLEAYPEISLDLVFDDGFVDIAGQGFDAGLRIGELIDKDMIGAKVSGSLQMVVIASPDYLARHGAPSRPADLADHRCVAFTFTRTGAISPWELVEDGREIAFTPDARATANSLALCVEAATQGVGLTFAVEELVAERVASGKLVRVLEPFCPAYQPLHLYWPSRRLVPPKLRALIEYLRDAAGTHRSWEA